MKPLISILIVAFNSGDFIEDCIGSIAPACARHDYEVLMIDNGDGSTEALVAERFPEVRILPGRGNIGFAAGNNVLAREARGTYLLLLNPDLTLFEGAIDALMDGVTAHLNASAWGGVTVGSDGKPNTGNAIPAPTLAEYAGAAFGRAQAQPSTPDRFDHDEQVEHLMGGFVLITRKAWEEADGLDERYFLYCEEIDLFYRLARHGHTFWRIAAARGLHEGGHGEIGSPIRLLYQAAGRVEFMRAHWSAPKRALGVAFYWLANFWRYLAGKWVARLRPRAEAHRVVAMNPRLWRHGYDKKNGLIAQLERNGGTLP